jgi:hypothetical protein
MGGVYSMKNKELVKKNKRFILGVGLDTQDGHKRITKGENFFLFGGSKDTHEDMRGKVVKLNEKLKKKGKSLDTAESDELNDIAQKVGIKNFSTLDI